KGQLQHERQRVVSFMRHADTAVSHALSKNRALVGGQDRVLQSLSYKNVLNRGYAVIRDTSNRPLTRAASIESGQALAIQFADGRVHAVAGGAASHPDAKTNEGSGRKQTVPKAERTVEPSKQGSLF